MKSMFKFSFVFLVLLTFSVAHGAKKPNLLVFMADDLGYGDVGCFGNTTIPTPNIDKIAANGMKLTQHLAAASVCTPSRAAFLTGRLPVRYGMASPRLNRVLLFTASSGGLPQTETTMASILRDNGYQTGLIGKWHLGYSCERKDDLCHHPNKHGFDYFYGILMTNVKDSGDDGDSVVLRRFPHFRGYMAASLITTVITSFLIHKLFAMTRTAITLTALVAIVVGTLLTAQLTVARMNLMLMRNDVVIEQPTDMSTMTMRIVGESIDFIDQGSSRADKPFFLMVSFLKVHTAHFNHANFVGRTKHGKYGDAVMELDWAIGQIMEALRRRDLINNTFVYFSSDNGGHLEEISLQGKPVGGYNGILPGGKAHGAVEGGIRVPTIISFPILVPLGSERDAPTSNMDIMPTMVDILKLKNPVSDKIIDGRSLLPLMSNKTSSSPHEFMFHYCGTYLHGIRWVKDDQHVYKVYFYRPKYKKPEEFKCNYICGCSGDNVVKYDPPLVYNVAVDPAERNLINVDETFLQKINSAVDEHQKTIDPNVESQFDVKNSIWRPWLQLCCNFPFCRCKETNPKIFRE